MQELEIFQYLKMLSTYNQTLLVSTYNSQTREIQLLAPGIGIQINSSLTVLLVLFFFFSIPGNSGLQYM